MDESQFERRRKLLQAVGATAVLSGTGVVAAGGVRRVAGREETPSLGGKLTTETAGRITKLLPENGDRGDWFGASIATSGDGTTAVVGAPLDNSVGADAGSAYVFSGDGGEWTQEAKLTADGGGEDDLFGASAAMSDDGATAVVGAFGDDNSNAEDAGSAYVFSRGGGEWTQQAKLAADDGESGDDFGAEVALSGDGTTAVVGASGDNNSNGEDAGSAYVFSGDGGEWTQQAKLAADDNDTEDQFGYAVAMSDDGATAVLGSPGDDNSNGEDAGSAYVFSRGGGEWTQQAKLAAEDGDKSDRFGVSVAMSGDGTAAVVGASGDDDPNGEDAGSGYVFSDSGSGWIQETKLAADDGDKSDRFGVSVAMSGDGTTAVVGAPLDNSVGADAGSAYVFSGDGGEWTQEAKLAADDGDKDDLFGVSAAMSGDGTVAIFGAWADDNSNGADAGSAYVFDTTTSQQTTTTRARTSTPGTPTEMNETTPATSTTAGGDAGGGSDGGGSTPGFGVVSLLAGLSGAGYLFRRGGDDEPEE